MKLLGAILVFLGCGAVGFGKAAACRREIWQLEQLQQVFSYMENELSYRYPPLPDLLRGTKAHCGGAPGKVLQEAAVELETNLQPDAGLCMQAAIERVSGLGAGPRELLLVLGSTMGKFQLSGQISGLKALQELGRKRLEACSARETERIRTLRTLGICAGAALVILLM